jgi:hypothetical protein
VSLSEEEPRSERDTAAGADGPATRSEAVDATLVAIALAQKAVTAYGREDLVDRLEHARARLSSAAFHVLVVGEFKQGKSSLVNALLGVDICPVDDDIATSVPTGVRFAATEQARVYFEPEREGAEPRSEDIPVASVPDFVTEFADPGTEGRVTSVDIGIPSPLLADGLVLVDTPGVGGLGSMHGTITIGALPMADGVLFVTDASQEFSEPELTFLQTARSMCPNLAVVLTKTDFYPAWRKILEIDQGHLARAGTIVPVLPVSSPLHVRASESGDAALDAESGVPALVDVLRTDIVGSGEARGVIAACGVVLAVVEQIETQFRSERQALRDPAAADELSRDLERAKQHADQMKGRSARWSQTLADGIGDLSSEIDHDLRLRFRRIIQEADDAIDASEPMEVWDEFEPWLYRRVAEDVVGNYALLQRLTNELSDRVAELFAGDEAKLPLRTELGDPERALHMTAVRASVEFDSLSGGQKAMTGLRGGYIGTLMFGALGSMVGLALGALPVAAGLVMGRKALKDEQARQLLLRRNAARNAVRRYVDEVQFMAGKDSRDTLRRVQRQLRDHYTARAEELQRSLTESQGAAQRVVQADQQTRTQRLQAVDAELTRLQGLRKQVLDARALATPGTAPA